ncbi:hypothetical protein E4U42_001159, partial [Claviceps africana]
TAEESKYIGTVIGKPLDAIAEIHVEGGAVTSIDEWIQQRRLLRLAAGQRQMNGSAQTAGRGQGRESCSSPTPSSGLSSVGSRLGEDGDEMDLS